MSPQNALLRDDAVAVAIGVACKEDKSSWLPGRQVASVHEPDYGVLIQASVHWTEVEFPGGRRRVFRLADVFCPAGAREIACQIYLGLAQETALHHGSVPPLSREAATRSVVQAPVGQTPRGGR